MSRPFKVLQVAAVSEHVKRFLLPLIDKLLAEGHQVHIACSNGRYVPELQARGYIVHTINIERRINPLSNLRSLWCLYRLMKKEQFDIVHMHTPIAAALGRVAAWAARVPIVINTVWAFYFHDQMPQWKKRPVIWAEKLLNSITDLQFFAVSEDASTAVRKAICPQEKVIYIGTGIDTGRFAVLPDYNKARKSLGFCAQDNVIGFVGRLVAEKGILELGEAMNLVVKALPEAKLVLVGDTLNSDRDKKAKKTLHSMLERYGIARKCVFTGVLEDIPMIMAAIDLLVHPSHRDGISAVILEAMVSGKPVVATNIRGSREAVVHGVTGILVPCKNPAAMAEAIVSLLKNPDLSHQMGIEGRWRACEFFDERIVVDKQVKAYAKIVRKKLVCGHLPEIKMVQKRIQLWLKRTMDIALSSLSLIFLSIPFLVIAILIKVNSPGPVFFRHERIGKRGRPFFEWKFRTMVEGAFDQGLGANCAKNDPRITRVGNVLREFGLDELPQLINVLLGEMSLVGPRPAFRYQAEQYNDFQRQRLLAKPGLTSPSVVNGRNLIPIRKRIKLDIWYIKHWSLWLDIKIICKTIWVALISRRGVYAHGGINDDLFVSTKTSSTLDQQISR